MAKTDYTRKELIALCQRAIVPETVWDDRDSSDAIRKAGECWALLKAGCDFVICTAEREARKPERRRSGCVTDDRTIWLEISFDGFQTFEGSETKETETFYLPTPARLKARKGQDWY